MARPSAVIVVLLASFARVAPAQTLGGCLKLQQTSDAAQVPRPASATATFTDSTGPVYAVDAFAGCSLNGQRMTVTPGIEWHRNTTIAKPQDALSAGADLVWRFHGYPSVDAGETRTFYPRMTASAAYKRDGVTDRNSLAMSAVFGAQWLRPRNDRTSAGCAHSDLSYVYRMGEFWCIARGLFRYSLQPGVEFQTAADTSGRESTVRGLVRLQSEYFPFADTWEARVQLVADMAYRHSSIVEDGRQDHHSMTISLNAVLLGDLRAGSGLAIGADYVNGADPSKGLSRQRYARITLKAQL